MAADNGTMGGKVSEEWMAITKYGEDTILYDEEKNIGLNKEILEKEDCKEYLEKEYGITDISKMKEYSAMELGNNFQLGTKYSENMNLYFSDSNSNENKYYMGCYGIGVGRIIAIILENNIVEKDGKLMGFSIPVEVAPYKVQIVYKEDKEDLALEIYKKLLDNNIDSIIDDRENLSLGNRIKDAYALGTPYILILGNNSTSDRYELESTKTLQKENINFEDLKNKLA